MKREYSTPSAYVELFTPNQYAGGCAPGVSEDTLTPIEDSCYFSGVGGSVYSFASSRSCTTLGSGTCHNVDRNKTLITTKKGCDIKFDDESSTGAGLTIRNVTAVKNDGSTYQGDCYYWAYSYGYTSGHHWMPITSLPGNYDDNGKPHYFNS